MGFKSKILGLGAALALGLSVAAPVSAQDTVGAVDVSVTAANNGAGAITIGLSNGFSAGFGTVNLNAVGDPTDGFVDAGDVTLQLAISGDDKLYREGGQINLMLGDGTAAGAYLDRTGDEPDFLGAEQVDFQIPGRYLTILNMQNPQQAKYTGGATSAGQIWNGTSGRAPRIAGNEDTGIAIYKVGDIYGTFNNATDTCRLTSGADLKPWNDACGDASFGETHPTKSIAGIYPGSGFVSATQFITLSLDVPGGVHPGLYQGTLTLEETFS